MIKPALYLAGMVVWSYNLGQNIVERLTVKTAPPIYVVEPDVHREIRIRGLQPFIDAVGKFESGNNYSIVNARGFMGRYQFNLSTLRSVGINVSRKKFLDNPVLQDIAMVRLMKQNQRILWSVIKQYRGKYHDGVLITESGILAAAHLVGPGAVLSAFQGDSMTLHTIKDGNGVSAAEYMTRFGGYRIRLQGIQI